MCSFKTFAYGSNMDLGDFYDFLETEGYERHPVNVIGKVILEDYKLVFDYWSLKRRKCGVADIKHSLGDHVEGLIIEMDNRLREPLRKKEGVFVKIYEEKMVQVDYGGVSVECVTYQVVEAKREKEHQRPSRHYLGLIISAAEQYDFSPEYKTMLKEIPTLD